MLSALLNSILTLNGTNFHVWKQQIISYLRSQGVYRTLQNNKPVQGAKTGDPDMIDAIKKRKDHNSKALGSILLKVHFLIAYKHRAEDYTSVLMSNLEKEYRSPGVAGTFLEFKKSMDLRIPEQQDPSISLDQFIGHISCLHEQKVVLAPELQSLLLLSKIPSSMTYLAQQFFQVDDLAKLEKVEKMRRAMLIAHEQKSSKGKQPQNQQQVQKISTVQRRPYKPGFQQQQQQGSGD